MSEIIRAGDYTAAQNIIKAQTDMLNVLKKNLAEWMIEFEFSITHQFDFVITAKKQNGQGIIKTIPSSEFEYYSADLDTLATIIATDIFDILLKNTIKNALAPALNKAAINVNKLKGKV